MTVAALPGNVRFRAFQMGPETVFGTPVAATRRYPWRFAPTIDPHWTDPDVDTGTLDRALPPYRTAMDVTGVATGALAYDDIPTLMAALYKPITPAPTGAAIDWTCLPATKTADDFQPFTGEWGDEVAADQFQYVSGVLESLQMTYPEDLGPIQLSANWRFATANYPVAKTAGLDVDEAPIWVYGADTQLFLNDAAGAIGTTPLVNGLHGGSLTITPQLDVKRFMNGSNTRFAAQGYGRGLRTQETTLKFAKAPAILAEAVKWLNADPVRRYLSLKTVSPTVIPTTAVPYSNDFRLSGFWYTRTEDTYGQANTALSLVCRSNYDPTLTYAAWWKAVCARATL